MDKDLSLFIGMMCGDGHLSIHTKKRKYGTYYDHYVGFCNTDKRLMIMFDELFYRIFKVKGHFYPRDRDNRKRIYEFHSYSKEVFEKISSLGFPIGVKRDSLRIPEFVKNSSEDEKLNFLLGVLVTDGCIRSNGTIIFHSGSKLFLEDLSMLLKELFDVDRKVKQFSQGPYLSYQLSLNKAESRNILLMPPSHSGSAPVLSLDKFSLLT